VTLQVPIEAKLAFEFFVTMATSESFELHPDFVLGCMCDLEMFSDLVSVLEQLFAAAMAALEDS